MEGQIIIMKKVFPQEVLQSESIAIADDNGKSLTYKQLADQAGSLSQLIEARSLIFILCDKHIETVELIYETLYLNIVPLLLSADINQEMLDDLIAIYRPGYIYSPKKRAIAPPYPIVREFAEHRLFATGFERYPLHPDLALLLSTSGTTGSPKLVKLSYENLQDSAKHTSLHLSIEKGQKGISPLPLNHVYGLTFCFWHWYREATLLVTEKSVIGNEFREFYERERANNFAATPYTYQMLERIQFWNPEILSYLHLALSSGAQMSEKDQLNLVSLMRDKFWIAYGQTECTCMMAAMNFAEDNMKLGSVGKAFRNMEVILDNQTHELCIKSKSVAMGYAVGMEDLALGDVNQGVWRTGDIGHIDADGCIFLRGRLARFIKILGKRISLDEIERYIKKKLTGIETACVGTDDDLTVYYSNDGTLPKEEIVNILVLDLKIPRRFITCRYIEEIPVNAAGKIMYNQLRAL